MKSSFMTMESSSRAMCDAMAFGARSAASSSEAAASVCDARMMKDTAFAVSFFVLFLLAVLDRLSLALLPILSAIGILWAARLLSVRAIDCRDVAG